MYIDDSAKTKDLGIKLKTGSIYWGEYDKIENKMKLTYSF